MMTTGKFDKAEYLRLASLSCVSRPQDAALSFLQSDDLRGFTDLLNTEDTEAAAGQVQHWLNLPAEESGAPLIEIAVRLGRRKFLECLVKVGARLDILSQASGFAPPHLAAHNGDVELLKLFLQDPDMCDVNIRAAEFQKSYSPLHLAAEKGNLDCLEYLLGFEEIDVDMKDVKGDTTPLLLAVKEKHYEAARMLIENGASLDIKAGRLTLRDFYMKNFPDGDAPATIKIKRSRKVILDLKDKVIRLLKETEVSDLDYNSKLGNFKTYMKFIRTLEQQNALDDVFDLAVDKGLHEHVEILLRKQANPNIASLPILEAAFYGHHKVLKVLSDYNANFSVTNATQETVLHLVLKMRSDTGTRENYQKCLDVLLSDSNPGVHNQMKTLINKKDDRGNTSLHYATQKWSQDTVRKLLELGANIGMKNLWDEIPISKIRPETMESYLSEFCLTSSGDVVHEDFSLTFRYDFLAPNLEALPEKYRAATGQQPEDKEKLLKAPDAGAGPRLALPETEPLWYMSRSKDHRHLLKHPVITSFLWYKWQRIRRYFNRNLRFFGLFVYLLTWYIFQHCGNTKTSNMEWYVFFFFLSAAMTFFIMKDWSNDVKTYQKNLLTETSARQRENSCVLLTKLILSNWAEALYLVLLVSIMIFGPHCLRYILAGLLVVFLLRELLQMFVSIKRYFASFENLLEIAIIVLATVILCNEAETCGELNRHFGAIVIVLSWAELIVLVGRHPKLTEYNIYVTMFLKVLKTFLFFITWYSLFIIAFGLGFYILLHKPEEELGEGDYVYFNKAWLSIVKTTTMFVGELEFSDIPIDLDSALAPLAYIYFLSFVFLIVVVLMNLLNGLAVSDTGLIREKAEIFSYRSQVETISTLESMLLGDPFDFLSNVPAVLSSLPSCSLFRQLYRSNSLSKIITKMGGTEILLFYKVFPDKSVTIYPNKRSQNCCGLR